MSAPDWKFWQGVRTLKVWQACALSLNMDPDKMNVDHAGWMLLDLPRRFIPLPLVPGAFSPDSNEAVFEKRLRILSSHVDDPSQFRVVPSAGTGTERAILLEEFADWAVNVVHWKPLPPKLARIAQASKAGQSTTNTRNDKAAAAANAISSAKRPLQRQRFQEDEILRVIRQLKYDPKALPKTRPGKSGVKAEVRAKLNFGMGVFKKAWERLRDRREIQDAT